MQGGVCIYIYIYILLCEKNNMIEKALPFLSQALYYKYYYEDFLPVLIEWHMAEHAVVHSGGISRARHVKKLGVADVNHAGVLLEPPSLQQLLWVTSMVAITPTDHGLFTIVLFKFSEMKEEFNTF